MALYRNCPKSGSLALAIAAALPVLGVTLPSGTPLELRLKTKVASNSSKPKDPVEAVVIAPVLSGGIFVVPAGTVVHGAVKEVKPCPGPADQAVLWLEFSELELGGKRVKIAAQVAGVENARESIGDGGRILGIRASQTISGQIDAGVSRVAERFSGLADVLGAAKGSVLKAADGDIVYDPGVEMTVKLTAPLEVVPPAGTAPRLEPVSDEELLQALVVKQPFQTTAQSPPKPSDVTNLMFIGSEEQLRKAFAAAVWSTAAALSAQSKMETFRAIAEMRGYKEAPVSILLLDGRPPDLVFQKQNNTFAMRHHLRIWKRPDTFQGRPVWVCAATHDTGIEFSQENRTFIHKIDPEIDRERAKVVNDLLLTGSVASLALADRPLVPHESTNATGDKLITDARIAVLIFK